MRNEVAVSPIEIDILHTGLRDAQEFLRELSDDLLEDTPDLLSNVEEAEQLADEIVAKSKT